MEEERFEPLEIYTENENENRVKKITLRDCFLISVSILIIIIFFYSLKFKDSPNPLEQPKNIRKEKKI